MNQRNYQKELDHIIEDLEKKKEVPRLLQQLCAGISVSFFSDYSVFL